MDLDVSWLSENVAEINDAIVAEAESYQRTLTKPPGSLGKLESLAVQFCGWQNALKPSLEKIELRVFAADHGICAQGVSAFPQSVTAQMIKNFVNGGAAINVLAEGIRANLCVVNLGTVASVSELLNDKGTCTLFNDIIAPQTHDFSVQAAMSSGELEAALAAGRKQVDAIRADVFIGGEMGIGNTSSAAAIYASLLDVTAADVCGPGTGLNDEGVKNKAAIVAKALTRHEASQLSPLQVLKTFGGFEIAALCAAYLRCAQRGIPVLVDGYICTAAALVAMRIHPSASAWFMFSHQSDEPAHKMLLQKMGVEPIMSLGLRLGEGSGAALAVPILQSAIALHNRMASFADAGVSESACK